MRVRLTNKLAQAAVCEPGKTAKCMYDDGSPLGLRVTQGGARSWFAEVWLRPTTTGERGRSVRRTIGWVSELSADAARATAIKIAGELVNGRDALQEGRRERDQAKADAKTLAVAVREYVKGKRRGKDGLPLKERTAHDYLLMIEPNGYLASLADKSIHRINAEDIRATFTALTERSAHSAAAAMRTLRATLNWHGISIEGSPFSRTTPGKDRIVLPSSVGKPTPIPPERLHEWWAAASAMAGDASADGLRFQLLTGCRPGEVFGSAFASGIRVADVDLVGGRVYLRDTKNRRDHMVLLSKQALEVIEPHCINKPGQSKVFNVLDPQKTLDAINRASGVAVRITPHKLRHTFTSVAEELLSAYVLKRLVNHVASDVTGAHYIGKSEAQLRAGWQTVADFITRAPRVIPLQRKLA